ncbi:MAG: helix-turn-helix transcriptional regulator [Chloroflexi bacterium]|nr:helix-turn-helix transcriptional regulator [Chloroflexota bacterium]
MPHKSLGRTLAREDAPIARAVGERIRAERLRARLTQQQLADPRYTKAYISALENGLAKPSLAALTFIAGKLGLTPASFLTAGEPAWSRLEADLALASGEWTRAVDAYTSLLEAARLPVERAELGLGLAEALIRLERGSDVLAAAGPAAATFQATGRRADAARARYWIAAAEYQLDNETEARSIMRALLDEVRAGLRIEPDFEVRLLIALAAIDGRAMQPKRALAYLDEARGVVEGMDDRRRATFLSSLAVGYRESGDAEAAIRVGNQAIARFRELEADREVAGLENELALTHLALGSARRARQHAAAAAEICQRLGDRHWLAHVRETQAQIELAAGDPGEAATAATEAAALADATGNRKAAISARLTLARAHRALGRRDDAVAALELAADQARAHGRVPQLRDVLTEWADLRAELGDPQGAYALSREALALARG